MTTKYALLSGFSFILFFILYITVDKIMTLREERLILKRRLAGMSSAVTVSEKEDLKLFQKRKIGMIEKKLQQYLKSMQSESWLQTKLYQSGLNISLTQFFFICVVFLFAWVVGIEFLYGFTLPVSVLSAVGANGVMIALILAFLRKRRQNKIMLELPNALNIILRAIKAGHSVERAFILVAKEVQPPIGSEFQRIIEHLELGVAYEDALHLASERVDTTDFHFFASALIIQRQTGGSLAEVIENIVNLLHRRQEIRHKAKALSAEGRTTGLILGSIPVVIWIVVSFTQPSYLDFFFYDPKGITYIKVVIGLLVFEALVIKWMVDVKVE